MYQGFQQGAAPQFAQGTPVYILDRKDFSVSEAGVVSVSQPHVSKAAPQNPMSAFQGLVVDLALSRNGETVTIEFPVNSQSANYPDKGWFLSPDRGAVTREVEAMQNTSKQYLSQRGWHEMIVQKSPSLLMQLNPERQKEAQQEQEISALKAQLSDISGKFDKLVSLLTAENPRSTKKSKEE